MLKKWFSMLLCSFLFCHPACAATEFHSTDGQTISSTALKGKWLIINYWADWCLACVEEIPELNSFYNNNHDKRVVLYGVNYDQPAANELKEMARMLGIRFPVMQEDPIQQKDTVEVLPTTFIVNPEGKVVRTIQGASRASTLRDVMRELQKS